MDALRPDRNPDDDLKPPALDAWRATVHHLLDAKLPAHGVPEHVLAVLRDEWRADQQGRAAA